MKKLITLLFMSFQLMAFAQPYFWSQIAGLKTSVHDFAMVNDSLIMITYISGASCPTPYLTAYNKQGDSLWTTDGEILVHNEDDVYYTLNYYTQDDAPGSIFTSTKYQTSNNNVISEHSYEISGFDETVDEDWHSYYPSILTGDHEGRLIFTKKNMVIKLDTNGTSVLYKKLSFEEEINHIEFIDPTHIVLSTEKGVYIADSSFTDIQSLTFDSTLIACDFFNDTIYTLFSDKIVRINQMLEIVDTIALDNNNVVFKKLKIKNNKIYVLGENDIDLFVYDVVIDNTTEYRFDKLATTNLDFFVSDNEFFFGGKSSSSQTAVFAYNMNVEPEEIILPDISLNDFEILPSLISPTIHVHFGVTLDIKNNGTEAIHYFEIFAYLPGGMNCSRHYMHEKVNMTIEPGEEVTYSTSGLFYYNLNINTYKFCFEILSPNMSLESNTLDNTVCKTVLITNTTNSISTNNSLELYPNPASDQLIIKTDKRISSITITNTAGNVMVNTMANSTDTVVDVAALNKGIYILSVNTDEGVIREKFVKE